MKSTTFLKAFAAPLLALLCLSIHAQTNTFEVAAGGGVADYFGSGNANSTKGLFEASALYNFAAHVGAGFEYDFSQVASFNNNYGGGYSETGSADLSHYGAAVRVPFAAGKHAEPFAAGHFGGLHESATATATGGGVTATASANSNGGYAGASVGVSLFITRNFGVRPELRYEYLHINSGHINEGDFLVSAFYRFGLGRK